MPKLIIDENTMKFLAEKLARFPIHAGPGGGMLEPGVRDLLDDDDKPMSPWQPADRRTGLLVSGAEACREICSCVEGFRDPRARKRVLKNLSISVCNLMDVVVELQKALNDDDSTKTRLDWPIADRNTFVDVGRRIRKAHLKGPVRTLRHKLGAHLDPEVFASGAVKIEPEPIMAALCDTLIVYTLAFNHRARAFSWIRPVGQSSDGTKLVVDALFDYPACARYVTDLEGNVVALAQVILAADPRHILHEDVIRAINVYNYLVEETKVGLPSLGTRPTSEVLAEEGRTLIEESVPSEFMIGKVITRPG